MGERGEGVAPVRVAPERVAPDGKPIVGPFDRAGWRDWLIEHHASSRGVYLAGWRRESGRTSVPYVAAVEEALCVGWVDSTQRRLDDQQSILWFAPRRPGSGWARTNKERVERLAAAGLMLPAGHAAVEEAKRRGTWSMLDEVEALVVPDDLAAALEGQPGAREQWDAFGPSARRGILQWIRQAKRPATRAARVRETAAKAALGQKANEWVPRDRRPATRA